MTGSCFGRMLEWNIPNYYFQLGMIFQTGPKTFFYTKGGDRGRGQRTSPHREINSVSRESYQGARGRQGPKIPGVGGWRWAMPPTPEFCVGDTNMLVYFGVA